MKLARDNKLAKLVFAQFSIGQVKSLEACSCPGYTRGSTGPQNSLYLISDIYIYSISSKPHQNHLDSRVAEAEER